MSFFASFCFTGAHMIPNKSGAFTVIFLEAWMVCGVEETLFWALGWKPVTDVWLIRGIFLSFFHFLLDQSIPIHGAVAWFHGIEVAQSAIFSLAVSFSWSARRGGARNPHLQVQTRMWPNSERWAFVFFGLHVEAAVRWWNKREKAWSICVCFHPPTLLLSRVSVQSPGRDKGGDFEMNGNAASVAETHTHTQSLFVMSLVEKLLPAALIWSWLYRGDPVLSVLYLRFLWILY